MTSRRRWLGLAAAGLLVQLVVLYWPGPQVPGGLSGLDLVVHATVFAAVAYPALRAGLPAPAVLGALAGHAVLSEVLQHTMVPGRSGDLRDGLADLAGLLLATLAWRRDTAREGSTDRTTSDLM